VPPGPAAAILVSYPSIILRRSPRRKGRAWLATQASPGNVVGFPLRFLADRDPRIRRRAKVWLPAYLWSANIPVSPIEIFLDPFNALVLADDDDPLAVDPDGDVLFPT
jgi:hypothetical protein